MERVNELKEFVRAGREEVRPHEGIYENLRFLILEVSKQLFRTSRYLQSPNKALARKVSLADDYIDNLKSIIQRKSYATAAEALDTATESVESLRTVDVIASNLERVADFCEKILGQVNHIDCPEVLARFDFTPLINEVAHGVSLIEQALGDRSVRLALKICRSEHTLDRMYAREFKHVLKGLEIDENGEKAQSLVTVLFIAHYFERMGDSLLNIGEAILSAHLGERIKIGQLRTLESSLDKTEMDAHLGQLSMQGMGETKSGARVASISSIAQQKNASAPQSVIFKEGKTEKLLEERDSIASWERLMPGLAPKIYSFHESNQEAAILFEYLPGKTFESILFECSSRHVERALVAIQTKLTEVWQRTRTPILAHPRFMRQLSARLDDVFVVHPQFETTDRRLGEIQVESFSSLLAKLRPADERLCSPFSVFIHGDFNLDNVIYDDVLGSVRFIDLHRSTMMDYVQDISVFLVSHYRLRILEGTARRRVRSVMRRFYNFARNYASEAGDESYAERLAIGVARSLASSTRFVLDPRLARDMFLRSRYLLERMTESQTLTSEQIHRFTSEVLLER